MNSDAAKTIDSYKLPRPSEQEIRKYLETVPTQCPECGETTDSLKLYTLPDFCLFLGFFGRVAKKGHVGCPKCMRKKILIHGMTYNIVTANILWLFVLLPWSIVQFIRTYTKGHSSEVVDILAAQK